MSPRCGGFYTPSRGGGLKSIHRIDFWAAPITAPLREAHADFDQAYDAINSYDQGSRAGTYTVRGGDSLQGIAAGLYGDSSLWYKIAEVNGLSANSALTEGTSLILPSGVVRSSYNANSFKPYDPAAAIGDTAPTAPEPPTDANAKCGTFGVILLAVVAVAVTVITKNAALGAKIFKAAGITLGAKGAAIATAAVAAAAGSVASQGVGLALGIQDKFSFKSLGLSVISAGVTAGGVGASVAEGISSKFVAAVVEGAVNNAVTQGIGVATGLQDSFSFAGVAAAGIGAGVGGLGPVQDLAGSVGGAAGDAFGAQVGDIAAQTVTGAAAAIANAATRSALDGSSFGDNIIAAIPDVIGQAVGSAIGNAVNPAAIAASDSVVKEQAVANPSHNTAVAGDVTRTGGTVHTAGGVTAAAVTGDHDEIVVTAQRRGIDISTLMANVSRSITERASANAGAFFDNYSARLARSSVTVSDGGGAGINQDLINTISQNLFGSPFDPFSIDIPSLDTSGINDLGLGESLGIIGANTLIPGQAQALFGGLFARGAVEAGKGLFGLAKTGLALGGYLGFEAQLNANLTLAGGIGSLAEAAPGFLALASTSAGRGVLGAQALSAFGGALSGDIIDIAGSLAAGNNTFIAGFEGDFIGSLVFDGTVGLATGGLAFGLRGLRGASYLGDIPLNGFNSIANKDFISEIGDIQGIYKFVTPDGQVYVGQSNNVGRRLGEHGARIDDGTEIFFKEIRGGKLTREAHEQLEIFRIGGDLGAQSDVLANIVNPFSVNRRANNSWIDLVLTEYGY